MNSSSRPLSWPTPRRVQIVIASGVGYFKAGQYAYVLSEDNRGGMFWVDQPGSSPPGQTAYLVSKTKEMRGGALWYSPKGLRFTNQRISR